MAYIDLKNVDFYLRDGYSKSGQVGTGGATLGATTVPIAGVTGKIDSGVTIKFSNHATVYKIVSTTETTGDTTSAVVTPALTAAVTATTHTFVTGGHMLKVKIGDGNLTYTEKVNREYKKDRGKLDQVRNGDEEPMAVNFQFAWEYLSSSTGATVPSFDEFLKQTGPAATYKTTGIDCEPFAVDIILVNNVPGCGSEAYPVEQIVLGRFRYESLDCDPKAGTVTCQGMCNATQAVKTRLAASPY